MPTVNINGDSLTQTGSDSNNEPEVNEPEVRPEESYESLVGRVELMNLKKIELGINLDEPVHISQATYVPTDPKKEIDPEMRPYQHQFEWYEDYYSQIGEEIANKNVTNLMTHFSGAF